MSDALDDALTAARLCAIDPVGLGGIWLRGGGDRARDDVIALLRSALPAGAPVRRLPPHIDDERLLGGLDLGATLAKGAAVARPGLLAEADGGVVVVPLAERLPAATAARIAVVIDAREAAAGQGTERNPARVALLLLDDGVEPEQRPPEALTERIAFHVDLTGVRDGEGAAGAQAGEGAPVAEDAFLSALVGTAAALGIDSARAPLFALRAARAAAQLAGRIAVGEADVALAARLVLGPRATRIPGSADTAPAETPPEQPDNAERNTDPVVLEDLVLAAVRASLPPDVLARLAAVGGARRGPASHARGAGERRRSGQRGRPTGVRAGLPRNGLRLSLIDTLRAAAPWQGMRRADATERRVRLRRDDLRIRRFETRAEATTIFAVDASGSSALARLAEAKGAVELLLAEAYVKRAQVALVAFRNATAEVLLPPTRSLARARRSLADLPGGGGTPLAAGLDAARTLAEGARARGRTPFVVVLTDGRANVAADGSTLRKAAEADAETAARAIADAGIAAAFIDISARARPEGARLAAAMGARYLPLPNADAATIGTAVRSARPPAAR